MGPDHSTKKHTFRNLTFTGFLVVLPVAAAFFVCKWLFEAVDGIISPSVRMFMNFFWLPQPPAFIVTLLGMSLTILIFFTVGLATTNYFGRALVRWSEQLFQRIPVFRNIYTATKQIVETFTSMEKGAFREAVIIEYPRREVYSLAFVTNEDEDNMKSVFGNKFVTVFVPTTPNPTSGYVVLVPDSDVIRLRVTVEEAMKFILSAGMIKLNHKAIEAVEKSIIEHAEQDSK